MRIIVIKCSEMPHRCRHSEHSYMLRITQYAVTTTATAMIHHGCSNAARIRRKRCVEYSATA